MINKIIATLLHDVSTTHGAVFNTSMLRKTQQKVDRRISSEGIGFLTKTLPRLGKAFDKALAGDTALNSTKVGFKPLPGSELPMFMGELFKRVLRPDGTLLQSPCVSSVSSIRQLTYCFYKYELPYTAEQERKVTERFERTEQDLVQSDGRLEEIARRTNRLYGHGSRRVQYSSTLPGIVDRARTLLLELFANVDGREIYPQHGPGAVADMQRPWTKYWWTNVSSRITAMYPLDDYFMSSGGETADRYRDLGSLHSESRPARVILVPKDSRGPRLISAEPVDNQWIQQGLRKVLVSHVERHPLTECNVFFTNQKSNQLGALIGSREGRYATLDLNEASDRVSLRLVRLLFGSTALYRRILCCRSLATVLPDGRVIKLRKFAPMGSALCFPIMALTIWALLTAAAPDEDTRECILVYGDDVIVPTEFAGDAMNTLESFGLKINRDKSCTKGFFRESCGMDAFKGVDVTPTRIRSVWSESRSPDAYSSWVAYANSFFSKRYHATYDLIVGRLLNIYRAIPSKDMCLTCPSLAQVPDDKSYHAHRVNRNYQLREYKVWDVTTPVVNYEIPGWSKFLRWSTSLKSDHPGLSTVHGLEDFLNLPEPRSVSSYTRRGTSMLVKRWRWPTGASRSGRKSA